MRLCALNVVLSVSSNKPPGDQENMACLQDLVQLVRGYAGLSVGSTVDLGVRWLCGFCLV
jgi:hypothetical protein